MNNRQPLNRQLSRICNLGFPKSPNKRKQQTTPPPTVNIIGVRQPLLADDAPSPGDSKLHFLEDMLLLSHLPNWWLSRLCDLLVFRDFQIHQFHLCRPALALPNLRVCCLPFCDYEQFQLFRLLWKKLWRKIKISCCAWLQRNYANANDSLCAIDCLF